LRLHFSSDLRAAGIPPSFFQGPFYDSGWLYWQQI